METIHVRSRAHTHTSQIICKHFFLSFITFLFDLFILFLIRVDSMDFQTYKNRYYLMICLVINLFFFFAIEIQFVAENHLFNSDNVW